jgi:hypothetical protein
MMQPSNPILRAWNRTPLTRRLSILAAMTIRGQRAQIAVVRLLALVGVMASQLSPEDRVFIADALRLEADALAPPSDRRQLH